MTQTSDLIVIGAGPGGYVAAIRASQLGMKVTLVEKEHLGGVCLNWGCIPTKALLRSAEVLRLARNASSFGVVAKDVSFDLSQMVARSRGVSTQLANGVRFLMKKNKVDVIDGTAKLLGNHKVEVTKTDGTKQTLESPHIILATGARPRVLPGFEPDDKLVWTSKEALVPDTLPKSMVIVGSGAIGIEFASFYHTLGVDVTVLEVVDRVIPVEDEEVSAFARKAFEKQGIKIHTGIALKKFDKTNDAVTVSFDVNGQTQTLTVDRVIVAVGIVGNVENVGLESTKAVVERTHVKVNEWSATGEPGLYAIGDVAGPPWLAHKASHEAVICVERIKGLPDIEPLDPKHVPGCTYCSPQVASVGLSESKAKAAGFDVKVGHFNFIGNGKAIALGETEGFIKTVFDAKSGELLGAHMVGPEVTEMIQGFVIGQSMETTERELMHAVFPHPTLSEAMHESVLDAFGHALHS